MSDGFIDDSLVASLGETLGNDNLGTIVMLFGIFNLGVLYVYIRIADLDSDLGPLTFVACRFIVSLLYLVGVYYIGKFCGKSVDPNEAPLEPAEQDRIKKQYRYDLFFWGGLVGLAVLGLTIGLQYGEMTQSAGQTSFIVAMYVICIPVAEMFLSGFTLTLSWRTWLAIALVIPGVFVLSGCTETNCFNDFQWGVLYNVLGMLCVTVHSLSTARGMAAVGPSAIILFSFIFCAIVSLILAVAIEPEFWVYPFTEITANWWLILLTSLSEFLSIICITIALGIISTTRLGVVMSLESLAGAFCGYIFLGETFSGIEYLGGALLLSAVLLEIWPKELACGLCDNEQCDKTNGEADHGGADESTRLL